MNEVYSTQDIWLGSLFLTQTDAQLTQVQTGVTGHSTVTFSFRGKGLSRLADKYHKQEALGNIAQIREKLNLLRDILFRQKEAGHAIYT